jgi:hypothetical protein
MSLALFASARLAAADDASIVPGGSKHAAVAATRAV